MELQGRYNFLVVSKDKKDTDKIKADLERNKLYKIDVCDTPDKVIGKLTSTKIDCLLYNLDAFTTPKIKLVTDLRALEMDFPIVLMANQVDKVALDELQKVDKTVMIEKPYETKDLWGICYKALHGKNMSQRIHRRFYTDQSAFCERSQTGETIKGQIYNLSRGGAYMEMLVHTFSPGEVVQMTIPLEKVSRNYKVEAQVVWSTTRGFWKGNPAAGFKFLKAGDVYRNLLEKI